LIELHQRAHFRADLHHAGVRARALQEETLQAFRPKCLD
jgi:hypothetical protein